MLEFKMQELANNEKTLRKKSEAMLKLQNNLS